MLVDPVYAVNETAAAWYNDPNTFAATIIITVVVGYVLYRLAKYVFDRI